MGECPPCPPIKLKRSGPGHQGKSIYNDVNKCNSNINKSTSNNKRVPRLRQKENRRKSQWAAVVVNALPLLLLFFLLRVVIMS